MATKDTVVQELIVNTLTQAQFDSAEKAGTLSPYELYGTPDTSVRLPVLTPMWFDHLVNDVSWLRAETFSWQSGDVYKAAYEHLVADLDGAVGVAMYAWYNPTYGLWFTLSENPSVGDYAYSFTDTTNKTINQFDIISSVVSGVSISLGSDAFERLSTGDKSNVPGIDTFPTVDGYYVNVSYMTAQDGHKICLPNQEINISALYETTGAADYYLLDTTNKQFKLPRKQKRRLIQAVKNTDGTWYNMYSDGWVEQGGFLSGSWTGARTFNLPVAMSDTGYTVTNTVGCPNISGMNGLNWLTEKTKTSITFTSRSLAGNFETNNFSWQVNGYAAESAYASAGIQLEYYYVGNYTQDAVEQTAGINAETFNGKLDIELGNATAGTKETALSWIMPDYSAGVTVSSAVNTSFVVPVDSVVLCRAGANSRIGLTVGSSSGESLLYLENINSNTAMSYAFVAKGTTLYVSYRSGSYAAVKYYPLKGAN